MPAHPTTRSRRTKLLDGVPPPPRTSVGAGVAGLAGTATLLASAHGAAAWSSDPRGLTPQLVTLGLVTASLAMLVLSAWGLVGSTLSPGRPVFRVRRLVWCAVGLFLVSGAVVASLVTRDPFQRLAASGRVTAHDIVDVGCVLAAVIGLTGAVIAAVGAWESFDDERHWGRSLGIGP